MSKPTVTREEARAWLKKQLAPMEREGTTYEHGDALQRDYSAFRKHEAACLRLALAALEDAERYAYLCEYRAWPDDVAAAFDCGGKPTIDAAIDRARGL